ncbi:MAG: LapA family protein [Thermodesulfobacteriota bacterium]|nr:LapA family protein [Thermodesulfobacteriota bacterium]
MRYIRALLLIVVIVAGILFGISNQQPATIKFFGYATQGCPLYLILSLSFLIGAIIAFIYSMVARSDMLTRKKLAEERVLELEKQYQERLEDTSRQEEADEEQAAELAEEK